MGITIKPSDLYNKYHKDTTNRHKPKFEGKPDPEPFDRDDLYEIIPMFEAVMDALGRDDQHTLHMVEEVMLTYMPLCVSTREEVFDFLVGCMRDTLEDER